MVYITALCFAPSNLFQILFVISVRISVMRGIQPAMQGTVLVLGSFRRRWTRFLLNFLFKTWSILSMWMIDVDIDDVVPKLDWRWQFAVNVGTVVWTMLSMLGF